MRNPTSQLGDFGAVKKEGGEKEGGEKRRGINILQTTR